MEQYSQGRQVKRAEATGAHNIKGIATVGKPVNEECVCGMC